MISKNMTIAIKTGMDARPVAIFVQVASQFNSSIHVEMGNVKVNAKSIMGMMALKLEEGSSVTVSADGADETEAINKIEEYLSSESK